jgi:hypothetical protein
MPKKRRSHTVRSFLQNLTTAERTAATRANSWRFLLSSQYRRLKRVEHSAPTLTQRTRVFATCEPIGARAIAPGCQAIGYAAAVLESATRMATTTDPLEHYRTKRNFGKSPEPKGELAPRGDKLVFVIQKHARLDSTTTSGLSWMA